MFSSIVLRKMENEIKKKVANSQRSEKRRNINVAFIFNLKSLLKYPKSFQMLKKIIHEAFMTFSLKISLIFKQNLRSSKMSCEFKVS